MIEQVAIEITRECNLACPFCHASANENLDTSKYLTAQQWITGLEKIKDIKQLNITGGECMLPSVWPKTLQIAKHFAAKGVVVKLNTNGTNIQDMDGLPAEMVKFQLSIDGPEKVHDKIRGKGTYAKAMKFLEHYQALGYQFIVKGVLFDPLDAIGAVDNAAELTKKYGVEAQLQVFGRFGRAKTLEDKVSAKRKGISAGIAGKGVVLKEEIKVCKSHLGAGGMFADIDEYGFFIPCSQLRHLSTGINILDEGYSEIKVRLAMKKIANGAGCSC